MLTPTKDATFFNRVLNHPVVRPDVADLGDGPLDVSGIVERPSSLLLTGEHGGCLLFRYFEGTYEVHTAVLPSGRGAWATEWAEAVLWHMFTATDAIEIITRVPQGHIAAKALTEKMGFRHHFTTLPECLFRGERVPCHIYVLTIQDWVMRAPGLANIGAAFHVWLSAQVGSGHGEPHQEDVPHNRVVAAAIEMMRAGRVQKGLIWYNRWAVASRHQQIAVVGSDPVQVRCDVGIITMDREGGLHFSHAN